MFNLLRKQSSLKTKYSLLVTAAVMIVVTVLGIYFDGFIKKSFLESTHARMLHGFKRLSYNLKSIENELREGLSFVKSDERMIASIELINNYQDKNNYNIYLIDEEKKSIANQLLSKVKLSFNDDIALYDKNHELVAFVAKQLGGYQLSFISYQDGRAGLLKKDEYQAEFSHGNIQLPQNISLEHKNYYDPSQLTKGSLMTYHRLSDQIVIKVHQNISNEGAEQIAGHIEMSRILDRTYFEELSDTLDLDLQYSFDPSLGPQAGALQEGLDSQQLNIHETEMNFSAILKHDIQDGSIYYITNLNKIVLNALLNDSRGQFLIFLILVAISTLLLMRYVINRGLDRPLSKLMEQIHKIESRDYSASTSISTGDELEEISVNINRLARTVRERESSLESSMEELEDLSAQVRMLLDSTAEAIYGLDMEGNCTFANPSCVKMLGYSSADDLIGRNMHELIHYKRSDDTLYPKTECFIFHVLLTGKGVHVDNEVLWRADGSSFQAEYWSYPISRDGEVTGAVVTFMDITDRRQAEKGLRRAQKMDAIGQLTGGIAHDFNNILAVILGNLELLERQVTADDKVRKRIESMKKAGQRAADLTKQLLSFSRSQQNAQLTTTDINRLIGEMENLISRSLTPEVEVNHQFANNLWLTRIDPGDFEDALLNLSLNARDAMSGHGHLTIETRNATLDADYCDQNPGATPGEYVELAVSDSGEGILPEQLDHIFEPFFTTKEQGKGTGLGLAMVFGFVKRSGGYIKCYSEVGVGSTFRLYLPRAEGEMKLTEQKIEPHEVLPRGTETLLVVDDEADLLELAREALDTLGYRVQTAIDGRQALQQLAEDPAIDMLFSDVVMPGGINGYELAEQAMSRYPELKVLLTSGYTGKAAAHNYPAHFSTNLLSKPYSQAELAKRVRDLLDMR